MGIMVLSMYHTPTLAMSVARVAAEESFAGIEREVAETAAREAIEAAEANFGRIATEEMSDAAISKGIREAMEGSLKRGMEELAAGLKNGTITQATLKDAAAKIFSREQETFLSQAKTIFREQGAFNTLEEDLLGRMGAKGAGLKNELAGMGIHPEPTAFVKGIKPGTALEGDASAMSRAGDEVKIARNRLSTARGTSEEAAAKARVKAAHDDFNAASAERQKAATAKKNTAQASQKELINEYKIKSEAGGGATKRSVEQELAANEGEIKQAEAAQETTTRSSYKEQYEDAEAEYTTAKGERNRTKSELNQAKKERDAIVKNKKSTAKEKVAAEQKVSQKQAAYEEAESRVAEAEKNMIAKRDQLMEKSGIFENKWMRTKITARSAAGKAVSETKNAIWSKVAGLPEQLLAAVIFMLPNMVMDIFGKRAQNEAKAKTLLTPQWWGHIWLKVNKAFVDTENPDDSLYLYIGKPTKDTPETKDFLKHANYYVADTKYAPWGTASLTDPNFPEVMVHLNTGYMFVSDGQPEDPDYLTYPLLKLSEEDRKRNIKTMKEQLNALSGRASKGSEHQQTDYYVYNHSVGYAGDTDVGKLFESSEADDDAVPPLLEGTITALEQGAVFARDKEGKALFHLKTIRGWHQGSDTGKGLIEVLSDGDMIADGALDKNYALDNVHIYQTKDTPLLALLKKQLKADTPDKQKLLDALVDYVVMLDESGRVVPLLVMQPKGQADTKQSVFASYQLNPDIRTMVSLLTIRDGKQALAYDARGKSTIVEFDPAQLSVPTDDKNLLNQIQAIRLYAQKNLQYGPFTINGVTMTIDKTLVDKGVYIYKAAGTLEGGADDYVVPVRVRGTKTKKYTATALPDANIVHFVSLVTSRFYDGQMVPYAPPLYTNKSYFIGKRDDDTLYVGTGAPSNRNWPTSTAPLFTLYMPGPFNPSTKPANYTQPLPVPAYWALNNSAFSMQDPDTVDTTVTIQEFLTKNQPALLAEIQEVYQEWSSLMDMTTAKALLNQMGPFLFSSGFEKIYFSAVSVVALAHQYYIYTSDRYPGEYLVMSSDEKGSTVGMPINVSNPQPYAISLSNGNVYYGKDDSSSGTQQGLGNLVGNVPVELVMKKIQLTPEGITTRVRQASAQIQKIITQLQARKNKTAQDTEQLGVLQAQLAKESQATAALTTLLDDVQKSQTLYKREEYNSLYGDLTFGKFQFYLPAESFYAGQYIYADVTGLGAPLTQQGQENSAVVNKVTDYYVTLEEKEDSQTGAKTAVIGNKLSNNTQMVISLISGGAFDRSGVFKKSYPQITIVPQEGKNPVVYNDLNQFTSNVLDLIKLKSGRSTIVLQNKIQPLLAQSYKETLAQIKAQQDALKNPLEQYPSMSSLAADLLSDSLPYVSDDSPNILPRYLKKAANGKYYFVTPASVVSSDEERIFADYYAATSDQNQQRGIIYDNTGKPIHLLEGWPLFAARAYAGITQDKNGAQKLSLGTIHPPLQLVDQQNKSVFVQLPLSVKKADGAPQFPQFQFYYNTQTTTYFVKVINAGSQYWIELVSGFAYNLDGSPRWAENPVYKNEKGDILLVGTDNFGLHKVAFKPGASSKYFLYNQIATFGNLDDTLKASGSMIFNSYNTKGSFITMLSDQLAAPVGSKVEQIDDTSATTLKPIEGVLSELRLGYAQTDMDGNPLPSAKVKEQPYYLVWSEVQVENPLYDKDYIPDDPDNPDVDKMRQFNQEIQLIGKYTPDPVLKFSLLAYVRTRPDNKYVEEDDYFYPVGKNVDSNIKSSKVVGIIFANQNNQQQMKELFYRNQRIPLTPAGTTQYRGSYKDESGRSKAVMVKIERETVNIDSTNQHAAPFAQWISITDGTKILDYLHEPMVWDAVPLPADVHDATNLLYNKEKVWKVNTTNYVPSLPGTYVAGATALATVLKPATAISKGQVYFSDACLGKIPTSVDQELQKTLSSVRLDTEGYVFTPEQLLTKKPLPTKVPRYVYQLGKNSLDKNLPFYKDIFKGWYVDLSNGILYEPADTTTSYPSGFAILPDHLVMLLNYLRLYVRIDAKGMPQLAFRSLTECGKTDMLQVQAAARKTTTAAAMKKAVARASAPKKQGVSLRLTTPKGALKLQEKV